MAPETPEITVLISTFNDRDLVEKKLREIQAQSAFSRAEFIFIEPASPGKERELLEPFCARHPNCRLIALEERVSLYRAWNLGWEEAEAPYVCISNMDDTMHPRLLEHVLEAMPVNDWDLASVLIAKQSMDAEWNSWEKKRLRSLDLSTRPGPFFVWKRGLIDDFGMFDEQMEIAGDKDFWARATARRLKIGLIPKILYLYTKHPGQLSKSPAFAERKASDAVRVAAKSYPHGWPEKIQRKIQRLRCSRRLCLVGLKVETYIYVAEQPN